MKSSYRSLKKDQRTVQWPKIHCAVHCKGSWDQTSQLKLPHGRFSLSFFPHACFCLSRITYGRITGPQDRTMTMAMPATECGDDNKMPRWLTVQWQPRLTAAMTMAAMTAAMTATTIMVTTIGSGNDWQCKDNGNDKWQWRQWQAAARNDSTNYSGDN